MEVLKEKTLPIAKKKNMNKFKAQIVIIRASFDRYNTESVTKSLTKRFKNAKNDTHKKQKK